MSRQKISVAYMMNICLVYKFAGVQLIWALLGSSHLGSLMPLQSAARWLSSPELILACSCIWDCWLLVLVGWSQLGQRGQFCSVPGELSSRKLAQARSHGYSKEQVLSSDVQALWKPLLVTYLLTSCWSTQAMWSSTEWNGSAQL